MKKLIIVLVCMGLLSCQHAIEQADPPAYELSAWNMQGKFSFYHKETVLGSFEWERQPRHYKMFFHGPLSVGTALLEGGPLKVRFSNDRGEQAEGDSAEELLDVHMGWHVPIEALPYWVQGKVVPREKAVVTRDEYGRLAVIEQLGWRVEILEYHLWHGLMMPKRFLFKRDDVWGKLVIKSWGWPEVAST